MKEFVNEGYGDYSIKEVFDAQKAAIDKVNTMLGKEYPNIIDGKEVFTEKKTVSINPANLDETIGIFQNFGIFR